MIMPIFHDMHPQMDKHLCGAKNFNQSETWSISTSPDMKHTTDRLATVFRPKSWAMGA
jgi:hypothetical protein